MKNTISVLLVYIIAMIDVGCGADFQNLGFDEINGTGLYGPTDPAKALPGWTLLKGGAPYGVVYVNNKVLAPTDQVELGDYHELGGFAEGKYGLYFYRENLDSPMWSIEQTGTIPATARYLTLRCFGYEMQVQINDEIIPRLDWQLPPFDPQVPGRGPNFIYDVSAYAGQEVRLALVGPVGVCGVFGCEKDSYVDSLLFLDDVPKLNPVVQTSPGSSTNIVTLTFKPIPGRDMYVQYRDDMSRSNAWTYLPISTNTPGKVIDVSPALHRIYQLQISVPFQALP